MEFEVYGGSRPQKIALFDHCKSEGSMALQLDHDIDLSQGVSDRVRVPCALGEGAVVELFLRSSALEDRAKVPKEAMIAAMFLKLRSSFNHSVEMFEDSFRKASEPFDPIQQQQHDVPSDSSSWRENTEDLDALMDSMDDPDSDSDDDCVTSGFRCQSQEIDEAREARSSCTRTPVTALDDCLSIRSRSCSKSSRKQKIKCKIQVLRKIIPGGKGMEAATVLEETIHHIRRLQQALLGSGSGSVDSEDGKP